MTDADRTALRTLRTSLLAVHKILLDWERRAYERDNGRTAPAELLRVLTTHPQFTWLRPLSELIIRIDVMLDPRSDLADNVDAVLVQGRLLTTPDEGGNAYARRYHAALQELPDAVLAHRDVIAALEQRPVRAVIH